MWTSSCSEQAHLLCGMCSLPGPGIEPMSPALAGGFLSTIASEKSNFSIFLKSIRNEELPKRPFQHIPK